MKTQSATRSDPGGASTALRVLDWYDANARELPWRVGPLDRAHGRAPDPYRVWLSEVMLQQTTVATVRPRFAAFIERWPGVHDMAQARLDDVLSQWAGLGYYARARNMYACARAVVDRHAGQFPSDPEILRKLPGIGDYTAAAIAAIAFDAPAVVVDGNIERVAARLFGIMAPLPGAKPAIKAAVAAIWPDERSGDFAQALMDIGALICRPRSPACGDCPLADRCVGHRNAIAESLPRKRAKPPRPLRRGRAYALFDTRGRILLERRPDNGLLGGMACLPSTPFVEGPPEECPPADAAWKFAGVVRHAFTHFTLELEVKAAEAPARFRAGKAQGFADAQNTALPTLMRKAAQVALAHRRGGMAQN